jgi:hypothetical protein
MFASHIAYQFNCLSNLAPVGRGSSKTTKNRAMPIMLTKAQKIIIIIIIIIIIKV